jgi:hypothetical protein
MSIMATATTANHRLSWRSPRWPRQPQQYDSRLSWRAVVPTAVRAGSGSPERLSWLSPSQPRQPPATMLASRLPRSRRDANPRGRSRGWDGMQGICMYEGIACAEKIRSWTSREMECRGPLTIAPLTAETCPCCCNGRKSDPYNRAGMAQLLFPEPQTAASASSYSAPNNAVISFGTQGSLSDFLRG